MRPSVCCACVTAARAMSLDSCTRRAISCTEDVSSSVAEATDCTLADACSAAAATVPGVCCGGWAVEVGGAATGAGHLLLVAGGGVERAGASLESGPRRRPRADDAADRGLEFVREA